MTNINKKNVLVNLISIIWCIVSIWAISFLMIFQANANDENPLNKSTYDRWIPNNAGVLKLLNFTKSWNQNDIINTFYMENNNVIVKKPNIVVPSLEPSGNIILWWDSNKTNSLNPIIWWKNNTSSWVNTVFWWESNMVVWNNNTSYWWKNTKIESDWEWGNFIIWWQKNEIWNFSNNSILWWEYIIINWDNIIAAWSNISGSSPNSFIFNNLGEEGYTFSPENENTFYINSVWGLWLNWEGNDKTTVIHWWVSVWEIDLDNWCTDIEDIGIIWTANSCLLACTQYSLNSWWSLLENSQTCVDWCKITPKCVTPPVIPPIDTISFTWYCTWNIFTWSTPIPCFNEFHPELYENVVFTYNYVNECPNRQEELDNPCTYKCPEWYSFGDWTCKKNCVITWNNGETISVFHGESIDLYLDKNPKCPQSCQSKPIQCDNWKFTWNFSHFYKELTCQIQEWNQCNENEYNIEESDKIEWWIYSSCTWYIINWNKCEQHIKYKFKKCSSGYFYTWWTCHKDCNFNWNTIHYWETITWYMYKNSNCKDEYLCDISKILKCGEWWSFWTEAQTYPYTWCKLIWENCSGFSLTKCPDHWICSTCTWYNLENNSCKQFIRYKLDSCNTWYTKDWNTCKSDCQLPRWGSLQHSWRVIWYKNNIQYCPDSCDSSSNKKTMICNDGTLSWSQIYIYSWCTTKILSKEWFNRSTKVNYAICEILTWYSIQNNNSCVPWITKYKCTKCQTWYTRNGKDWDGNEVKCLKDCEFISLPNNTTKYINWSWWTITTYNSWYFECPDTAISQIRTCYDWFLDGSFRYIWYIQTWTACTIETWEKRTFTHQLTEYWNNLSMVKSCRGSAFNWNTCTEKTTYYTYKCDTGYTWANNNSKCIKCEWTIPLNAHENNSDFPNGNSSINYSYSTNTSQVCTFSCDHWFTRNSESNQCVSNDKKCRLANGNEYPELTYQYIYKENERICSNTCNKIHVQCINGSRRDYTTDTIITWENIYSSCSLKTGHVQSNWEPKVWLCTASNGIKLFTWNNPPEWNVILQWLCTNYTPNGETCKKWTEYKAYYCANGRSWNACYLNCTHNWQSYPHWTKITMHNKQWNVICSNDIQSETRICDNGKRKTWNVESDFSTGFIYKSYTPVWNECTWFNLNNEPIWTNYETCEKWEIKNWACVFKGTKYKAINCESWFYLSGDNKCYEYCILDWKKIKIWESATGYLSHLAMCPNECMWINRTCLKWKTINGVTYSSWLDGGGHKYSYCSVWGTYCSNIEYPYDNIDDIPEGYSIITCTWYNFINKKCNLFLRYKTGECLSWYSNISGECKKDCTFTQNWITKSIKFWEHVVTYLPTQCPWTCEIIQNTCGWNWALNLQWNFTCVRYSKTCSSQSGFNFDQCPSNWICETCTWYNYNNSTKQCEPNYKYKLIWCKTHYTLDWNNCYRNCTGTVFGDEIIHRTTVIGRKFKDGICDYKSRICYDGIIRGDSGYNLKECSTCTTPRWTIVASWNTATWYKTTKCTSQNTSSCPYVTRICKNHTRYDWNIQSNFPSEYQNQYCTISDWESQWCSDKHDTKYSEKITGWIYTGWCRRYIYNGGSCFWQEYFKLIWCESGYTYAGNTCYKWCEIWNKKYKHWDTATWYAESSITCSNDKTECRTETRTCINWERYNWNTPQGFMWLYQNCTKSWNICSNFPLEYQPQTNDCGYQVCQTYDNNCNQNGQKYGLNYVNTWYYATGYICNPICGKASNPCNWSYYTASWVARKIDETNERVYLYWNTYMCKKNNDSVKWIDEIQCNCVDKNDNDAIWNGTWCFYLWGEDLCDNFTIYGCVLSYPIEKDAKERWYKWKCKNGRKTSWLCHICNTGYERNKDEEECVAINTQPNIGAICKWVKPEWEHVIMGPMKRINEDDDETRTYYANAEPEDIQGRWCAWSCSDGYKQNWNWCIKDSVCWDTSDYGLSPWLNKDKLCSDGWNLVTQSSYYNSTTAPTIYWNLDGNLCKPIFRRYCKKDSTTKECTEESLNTAYIKVGFENRDMYLDWIYNENNIKISDADDITAKMGYYNKITDGPYTCAIMPSDELFYDGLSTTHIPTDQFNGYIYDTLGWKIHNFNYTPSIYTINNVSYILSTIRWEEGEFKDYRCHTRNWDLRIFSCPDMIIYP